MAKMKTAVIHFSDEFLKIVASAAGQVLDTNPSSDEERECLNGYSKGDQLEYGLNCGPGHSAYREMEAHSEYPAFGVLHMGDQIKLVKPHFNKWGG